MSSPDLDQDTGAILPPSGATGSQPPNSAATDGFHGSYPAGGFPGAFPLFGVPRYSIYETPQQRFPIPVYGSPVQPIDNTNQEYVPASYHNIASPHDPGAQHKNVFFNYYFFGGVLQ